MLKRTGTHTAQPLGCQQHGDHDELQGPQGTQAGGSGCSRISSSQQQQWEELGGRGGGVAGGLVGGGRQSGLVCVRGGGCNSWCGFIRKRQRQGEGGVVSGA